MYMIDLSGVNAIYRGNSIQYSTNAVQCESERERERERAVAKPYMYASDCACPCARVLELVRQQQFLDSFSDVSNVVDFEDTRYQLRD